MLFSLASYENLSLLQNLLPFSDQSSVNIMATAGSFFVTVYILCNSQLSCTYKRRCGTPILVTILYSFRGREHPQQESRGCDLRRRIISIISESDDIRCDYSCQVLLILVRCVMHHTGNHSHNQRSIQILQSPKNSNFRAFQDKIKKSLQKLVFRIFRFTVVSIHWSSNGCAVLHFHIHVHGMCKFIV